MSPDTPTEETRSWLVWVDDSPLVPGVLLTAGEAAKQFAGYVEAEPEAKVEILQVEGEWA